MQLSGKAPTTQGLGLKFELPYFLHIVMFFVLIDYILLIWHWFFKLITFCQLALAAVLT
jgi:cellulose synthase/poly-beta-1,6-N-acetylglucosamine synthase-like glycosyltransferase